MVNSDVQGMLQPYFDCELSVDDKAKILELHERFRDDILSKKVNLDGVELIVKPYPYNRSHKDALPEWFDGLLEKFVHVVTRDTKENRYKTSRIVREFRSERAVRIHWIKPILENASDKRITRFRYLENTGREREYFWYRAKGYMVVVEYVSPFFALITGFCVDSSNHAYYMRKYQNRI
ncbi:MAG: hypothetical protein NC117_03090 [Pseudoflavonifractor sp.]|nr:hypothetical protein [Pseudoflavonifractor sp.]